MVLRLLIPLYLIGFSVDPVCGEERIETLFGCQFQDKRKLQAERVEEFLPAAFAGINASLSEAAAGKVLTRARKQFVTRLPAEVISPKVYDIPLPYFFDGIDILHDRKGSLEKIILYASSLPIRKTSILRLHQLMEEAFGPATDLRTRGKLRSEIPREIYIQWSRPEGRIDLFLDVDDFIYFGAECRLIFYPTGSARQQRGDRYLSPSLSFRESPRAMLTAYLDHNSAFIDGDGPVPPIAVGKTPAARFDQYGDTVYLNESLDFRTNRQIGDLRRRLEQALEKEFSVYPVPERYERILEVALGRGQIRGSGGVQVGAAAFLAHYDDPAALPMLREGLKVNLPGGVELYCAKGIAKTCTGPSMLETVEQFRKDEGKAHLILFNLPSEKQIEELRLIQKNSKDATLRYRLDGCLTLSERNLEKNKALWKKK
ncbi:MAG: hypothetical protein P1V20_03770 [Verrucomicrobiales bacterium]|nr:hypothetical protein [Verrucomicrobiales bacterium]